MCNPLPSDVPPRHLWRTGFGRKRWQVQHKPKVNSHMYFLYWLQNIWLTVRCKCVKRIMGDTAKVLKVLHSNRCRLQVNVHKQQSRLVLNDHSAPEQKGELFSSDLQWHISAKLRLQSPSVLPSTFQPSSSTTRTVRGISWGLIYSFVNPSNERAALNQTSQK